MEKTRVRDMYTAQVFNFSRLRNLNILIIRYIISSTLRVITPLLQGKIGFRILVYLNDYSLGLCAVFLIMSVAVNTMCRLI